MWSCTHTPSQDKEEAMVSSHSWWFVSPGAMLSLLTLWSYWVLKFSWLKKIYKKLSQLLRTESLMLWKFLSSYMHMTCGIITT